MRPTRGRSNIYRVYVLMSGNRQTQTPDWLRVKYVVFAFVGIMIVYVLNHNERFIIDSTQPVWQHYESIKWWLLPHGLVGACALLLVPLQFSDRLRPRFTRLHRVIGRIYVTAALILAPLGAYIQYIEEPLGASRSFTVAAIVDAGILMATTGIGLIFAINRMIPQHRQWMTRSYAVALTFLEIRFFLGVTGLDNPPDFAIAEIVVWSFVAIAVLLGDLANQWYELQSSPRRPARARATREAVIAAE
jgi:uncharacterized membrane protein